MNKGIIAINKPKDWTSFDVVNKIKHINIDIIFFIFTPLSGFSLAL